MGDSIVILCSNGKIGPKANSFGGKGVGLFSGARSRIGLVRDRAKRSLLQHWVVVLTWRVSQEMIRDDAAHLAAGVSYFAIFSVFPILLGVLSIAGLALNSESAKTEFLMFFADNLPGSEDLIAAAVPVVERNVEELAAFSVPLAIISIVGLLWSATAVFSAAPIPAPEAALSPVELPQALSTRLPAKSKAREAARMGDLLFRLAENRSDESVQAIISYKGVKDRLKDELDTK